MDFHFFASVHLEKDSLPMFWRGMGLDIKTEMNVS